jgi:hypothetical protein
VYACKCQELYEFYQGLDVVADVKKKLAMAWTRNENVRGRNP